MEVNQKQLAQCLGISTRRIRQLREEGLFQKTSEKTNAYKLENCVKEYIDYKVNAETGRRALISKEEVQAQHEEIKKQISMIRLRKLKRELHEAEDVENFLADMLIKFRNRIMAVPVRAAMKVTGENDVNKITEILKKEMIGTLEALSEYDPEEIDGSGETIKYIDEEEDE